jgi:hypothetical protein
MTARPGNRASRRKDWQFELMKVRVAELAGCFQPFAQNSQRSCHIASPGDDAPHHYARHHTIREVLLPQ